MYLHVTFCGIFTIQQRLISCPLHRKTTLKISAEVDVKLVGVLRISDGNHEYANITTTRTVENIYTAPINVTEYPPSLYNLCFSFINIFLLHISGHPKICYFTCFILSYQHITGCKVSVDDLEKKLQWRSENK